MRLHAQTNIANLLGVAGTDIPIRDLQKLMMPFMVSLNIISKNTEINHKNNLLAWRKWIRFHCNE